MINFIPPNNIEAEMICLSSVLQDNALLKASELVVEDFYKHSHAVIWSAIQTMHNANEAVDMVTLSDYLADKKYLESVGGYTYISEICNFIPTSASYKHYENIVKDKAIRRKYIVSAQDIIKKACDDEPLSEIKEVYRQEFITGQQIVTSKEIMKRTLTHIEAVIEKGLPGLTTGFRDLDSIMGGWLNGNLYIVAARPSMGKSAFLLNSALSIAQQEQPVGILSLEMSNEQLGVRAISDIGNMAQDFIYEAQSFKKIVEVAKKIINMPIFFNSKFHITLSQLRNFIDELVTQHQVKILFIDYIQLIKNTLGNRNRESEVSEISRNLKCLAGEYNIPLIVLAQLNRDCEKRTNKRPLLSDLRESGGIEQDADTVIMIHREEYYDPNKEQGIAEFIIAKSRHSKTGIKKLAFDSDLTKFRDLWRK